MYVSVCGQFSVDIPLGNRVRGQGGRGLDLANSDEGSGARWIRGHCGARVSPWSRGVAVCSGIGGQLSTEIEALRIWAPEPTGRFHRKSAKIGGTGGWSRGAQMRDGFIFGAFHASQSGGALPPSAEALRIWAPAPTGRFHRETYPTVKLRGLNS